MTSLSRTALCIHMTELAIMHFRRLCDFEQDLNRLGLSHSGFRNNPLAIRKMITVQELSSAVLLIPVH